MTAEDVIFTFDLKDMFLSLQMGTAMKALQLFMQSLRKIIVFEPLLITGYSTQLLSLYFNLSLDAIGAGQDRMVYKITLSR